MSKDSLIDRLKSPIIRNELIKVIQAVDIKAIAKIIHDLLDVQLVDEDIYVVKRGVAVLLEQAKEEMLRR